MPRPRNLRQEAAKSKDKSLDTALHYDQQGKMSYIDGDLEKAEKHFQAALSALQETERFFTSMETEGEEPTTASKVTETTGDESDDGEQIVDDDSDEDEYENDFEEEGKTENTVKPPSQRPQSAYSMVNHMSNEAATDDSQDLMVLKGDLLVSLANTQLDLGRAYSAHKTASQSVKTLSMRKKESQNLPSTEARLVRARAITYMERRDEQYYDDEEEHGILVAEAVTDLYSVLHQEPSNQPAKNELAFLQHLKSKQEKDQAAAANAQKYFGKTGEIKNPGLSKSSSEGRLGALKVLVQQELDSESANPKPLPKSSLQPSKLSRTLSQKGRLDKNVRAAATISAANKQLEEEQKQEQQRAREAAKQNRGCNFSSLWECQVIDEAQPPVKAGGFNFQKNYTPILQTQATPNYTTSQITPNNPVVPPAQSQQIESRALSP